MTAATTMPTIAAELRSEELLVVPAAAVELAVVRLLAPGEVVVCCGASRASMNSKRKRPESESVHFDLLTIANSD